MPANQALKNVKEPASTTKEKTVKSRRRARGRPVGRAAEQTREMLIAAAEQHFENKSYAEVKLDEIAETAGLSGPAIYNHFASKDDLFLSAIIGRMMRYNLAVESAVAIKGNWKVRYNNLLAAVRPLQGTASGFQSISGAVIGRLQQNPEKFQEIRELRETSASYFRNLIAQGIEEGDFPPETDTVIAGDLLMAITIAASNTVTFYHPGSDELVAKMLKTLLGTSTPASD